MRAIFVLALMSPVFTALPATADIRDDIMAGSSRCAGLSDDRLWLDCYYGAAQPMRAKLGLPPAPVSQQNLVPGPQIGASAVHAAPAAPSTGLIGRVIAFAAPEQQKPELPTRMLSFKFDPAGYFIVVLANGETWRQSQGDALHAHWRGKPENYVVTILPGEIGSARKMKVANDQVYNVERIEARR